MHKHLLKNLFGRNDMELSKFTNGDKTVVIHRADFHYTLNYYLNNRLLRTEVVADFNNAEHLAEEYIMEGNAGPSLLNEES